MKQPDFRVIICGSRDWTDPEPIERMLRRLKAIHQERLVVVHGGARGADKTAEAAARLLGIRVEGFPVDHKLDGPWPGAGPRRNARMLRAKADLVVGFKDGLRKDLAKGGTENMLRISKAAGVTTVHIDHAHAMKGRK